MNGVRRRVWRSSQLQGNQPAAAAVASLSRLLLLVCSDLDGLKGRFAPRTDGRTDAELAV